MMKKVMNSKKKRRVVKMKKRVRVYLKMILRGKGNYELKPK